MLKHATVTKIDGRLFSLKQVSFYVLFLSNTYLCVDFGVYVILHTVKKNECHTVAFFQGVLAVKRLF